MQTLKEGKSKCGHIRKLTIFVTFPQVLNCPKIKNEFLFIKKEIGAFKLSTCEAEAGRTLVPG